MRRNLRFPLVGLAFLGALGSLAACGRGFLCMAEREPWRHEAAVPCRKSGAGKESAAGLRSSPSGRPDSSVVRSYPPDRPAYNAPRGSSIEQSSLGPPPAYPRAAPSAPQTLPALGPARGPITGSIRPVEVKPNATLACPIV